MPVRSLPWVLAGLLAAAPAWSEPSAAGQLEAAFRQERDRGHPREALALVEKIAALGEPSPDVEYLAAELWLDTFFDPAKAKPLLLRAQERGFQPWAGWPGTGELLGRISEAEALSPPLAQPQPVGDPVLTVYAGPRDDWNGPVLDAMPDFLAAGRKIYGNDLPAARVYLVSDGAACVRLHRALFPRDQRFNYGVGNMGIVVLCQRKEDGSYNGDPGAAETVGGVLHELGHAWMRLYPLNRDGYAWLDGRYRRWLDEGLADYAAAAREPAYLERRKAWVAQAARQGVWAPSFMDLEDEQRFYDPPSRDLHYWLSALLAAELLGDPAQGLPRVREILERVPSEDIAAAVKDVTGKDPAVEFQRLVARYWAAPVAP